MSYSKFTSMTATLVARNAEAEPSLVSPSVSQAHCPDGPEMPQRGFAVGPADNECALSHTHVEEGYMRWRSTRGSDFASASTAFDDRPSHRSQTRKLMVAMTDAEYEALALIAAKSRSTRHHVVRNALNGYFNWLVNEYAGTCRCISMLCSNTASATAESGDRRHLSGKGTTFPRASKRPH